MRKMKEAAAIVLSIAMVFGNVGVAKAAMGVKEKESNAAKQVKVQSEDGEKDSTISFDKESLNTRVGCFKEYKFQGVDAEKIQDVDFEYENEQDVLKVKKVQWYIGGDSEKEQTFYVPVAKKSGTEKVKATVTYENEDGDEIEKETEWTTFHVSEAQEGIVPFKSRDAFNEVDQYDKNKDGQISWDELNNLKSLWIDLEDNEYDDEDLEYLYKSENLEDVDLSGAENKDIEKLKEIKNLKILDLSGRFDSVKGLNGLSKLQSLRLSSDKLQDLSGISQLKVLTKLTIQGNYRDGIFKDVNDLKELDKLTKLELSSNKLEDISGIEKLTNLKDLTLTGSFKDMKLLKNLVNLESLRVSSDQLQDISGIEQIKKLHELILEGMFDNINGVKDLNSLTSIKISSDNLVDINVLNNLEKLEEIDLTQSPKADIGLLDKNRFSNEGYNKRLYINDKVPAQSILRYQKYQDCVLQKGTSMTDLNQNFRGKSYSKLDIKYQYDAKNKKVINDQGECIGKGETDITITVSNNGESAQKTVHAKVQDADDQETMGKEKSDDQLPTLTKGCGKYTDDNLSAIQKNGNVYDLQTKKKVADHAKSYVSNYVYCNNRFNDEYYRLDTKISNDDRLYTRVNNGDMKDQNLQITKNIKNYFITKQGELYRLDQYNQLNKLDENVKDIYHCFNADDGVYMILYKNGETRLLEYDDIVLKNIKRMISTYYYITNDGKLIHKASGLTNSKTDILLNEEPEQIINGSKSVYYGTLILNKNKLYYYDNHKESKQEVADNVKKLLEPANDIYEDLDGNYFYMYLEYKGNGESLQKKQITYTDKEFTGISKDETAYIHGDKVLNGVKSIEWIKRNNNYILMRKDGSVWEYQAPYIAKKMLDYDGSSEEQGSTADTGNQNVTTAISQNTTKPTTEKKQEVKVAKITLSGISHQITAGKKLKLTAKITNNATNKKLIWTTSNKKYATVSQSGIVTFNKKAKGKTVTITATAADGSKQKATYKVKIMKGAVKKITISGKKTVKAGKSIKLKAKVKASKGANKKLLWTSSNLKYAKVTSSGKVITSKKAKKKTVKITAMATDGTGKKNTVTIKIK